MTRDKYRYETTSSVVGTASARPCQCLSDHCAVPFDAGFQNLIHRLRPPVVEDVFGGHQPVADVKREQAILPRARNLRHQIRIPPDMIDVERYAERARA